MTTTARLVGPYEVLAVDAGDGLVVQHPTGTLGEPDRDSPVDVALLCLCWCQAITYQIWAKRLGIAVERLSVRGEADFDRAGLLGGEGAPRPGYGAVRIQVDIEGPDTHRHDELRAVVDEHCPLLDVFTNGVPARTGLEQLTT